MKKISTVLILAGLSLPVIAQEAPLAFITEVAAPAAEPAPTIEAAPTEAVASETPAPEQPNDVWTEHQPISQEAAVPHETIAVEEGAVETAGELASEGIAAGAEAAQAVATGTLTTAATVGIGIAAAATVYAVAADNSDSGSSNAGGTTGTR